MDKKTTKTSTLWRLLSLLKPKLFQYFASMTVVAAVFAAERIFSGFIVKWFTDSIVERDLNLLIRTVIYWGLFSAGQFLVFPIFMYIWRSSIVQGTANIRQAVFSHLQRLPLGYYEARHSGEAMSILTNDVAAAETAYQDTLMTLVQSIFQGISAIIFMLIMKWDLAIIIVLAGMVPLVVNAIAARPLRTIGDQAQSKLASLSERLSDLLAGFQVVRTFNLGEWILERFMKSNQEVLGVAQKRIRIEANLAAGNDLAGTLTIAPFIVGAYMVLKGQTTLGVLLGLVQLNNPVQFFVYSLGGTISRIQGALAAADRLLAVLDTPVEPDHYHPVLSLMTPKELSEPLPPPSSYLEFMEVKFRYSNNQHVLEGLSFGVQEGQVAAFVGPSGSGKSTVFRLLMGHYPVQAGRIYVSAKPIYDYSLSELRDLFAFVPQDAFLYSGTVLENIRYGKPGASEDEVIAAAQASYAHNFILELPEGYNTLVGERGARLSGGQRQRIAIARALLKNAPILLLDEATSALDSESETLVQRALEALMRGRTTLVIAHRLSTVEDADIIYVMEAGRVVEQGKHQDLVDKRGLYNNLYQLQFKDIEHA